MVGFYVSIFLVSKGDVFFLQQMMLLLVMVKHTPKFNIFIFTFFHCVLKTFDEVEPVEITKLNIEIILLRAIK